MQDVIIVGAGPVGLTAAVALARGGLDVLVLERDEQLSDLPRASTFHPPTLEMLDRYGLAEGLLERGNRVTSIQYRERRSGPVAELDYGVLADDTRFPFRLQCPQFHLAQLGAYQLTQLGGRLRFGAEVVEVQDDGEAVVTTVADGSRERARWLIGADGASSAVRGLVGIGFEGKTYPVRNLQIITPFPFEDRFADLAHVNYIFDPEEWCVVMRTPPQVWRVLFPLPDEEAARAAEDRADVVRRLARLIDDDVDVAVDYHAIYTVHQRVATTMRRGRVLLVGDAAHVNSPIGGMGMNSGIHDVFELVTPLLATQQDPETSELDAWAARRRQVAQEQVGRHTDRNTRSLAISDPVERERRNAELRELAADRSRARAYLWSASLMDAMPAR